MQHTTSQNGFTLLELLVVLVIIGLLVSMAAINTDIDRNKQEFEQHSKAIKFYLEATAEEAIITNQTLGLMVFRDAMRIFKWEKQQPQQDSSPINNQNEEPVYKWVPFQSRYTPAEKTETMFYQLSIEEQDVALDFAPEKIKKPNPQVKFFSTGEQTLSSLFIVIDDDPRTVEIESGGLGRYYISDLKERQI